MNFNSIDEYEYYEYVPKPSTPAQTPKHSPRPTTKHPHEASCSTALGALGLLQKSSITFSPNSSKKYTGKYRLVYISETEDKIRSVLGMSEPFEIKEHSD